MKLHLAKDSRIEAFAMAELCMAIVIAAGFGAAAFATNSQLLFALKSQKESAAATMVLQERKEKLRGTAFLQIADANYIHDNIFKKITGTENPLGALTERVTVDAYPTTGSPTVLLRDPQHPNPQIISNNNTLSAQNLLRVDILLTWKSVNGRTRVRQFSEIFGQPGNIGQ